MWRSIRRTSWVRDPWRALQGLDRIKGFLNALRQDPYHEPGDGVLRARVITLHRPQQLNALNAVLVDEPGAAALLAYDADDCIGCIVVFGSESKVCRRVSCIGNAAHDCGAQRAAVPKHTVMAKVEQTRLCDCRNCLSLFARKTAQTSIRSRPTLDSLRRRNPRRPARS